MDTLTKIINYITNVLLNIYHSFNVLAPSLLLTFFEMLSMDWSHYLWQTWSADELIDLEAWFNLNIQICVRWKYSFSDSDPDSYIESIQPE